MYKMYELLYNRQHVYREIAFVRQFVSAVIVHVLTAAVLQELLLWLEEFVHRLRNDTFSVGKSIHE